MNTHDFTSDAEVRALVSAFESGDVSLAEFSHSAHLAVALNYLAESPLPEASAWMRAGLQRFLARHGKSDGYHETLTLFWMRLLDHLARGRYSELPLWQRVNATLRSHGGSWPVAIHYSRGCATSEIARASWVAPDLVPLPF